jgi:hypothetical protein
MQKGKSLMELATLVNDRAQQARDYVAPTNEMQYEIVGEDEQRTIALNLPGNEYLAINDIAHQQIATHTGVPQRYYERMLTEAPELLVDNVQHWFDSGNKRRMVRTLDGTCRAFLSDRYRRLDNYEVLQAGIESIAEQKNAVPLASDVTDRRLYMKVLFPDVAAEVKPGDEIKTGVLLTNSEVGLGSLQVRAFFYRSYCTNGCVFGSENIFDFKRRHLGGKLIEGTDYQVISDETAMQEDALLLQQVRDTMSAAADQKMLDVLVASLRNAADSTAIKNPEAGIQVLAKEFGLTDAERQAALINLIEDRDYTQYGALNAVTKVANETESFDRINDLENIGGKLLNINQLAWNRIAQAEKVAA